MLGGVRVKDRGAVAAVIGRAVDVVASRVGVVG